MGRDLKQNGNLFDWKTRNSLISVGGVHNAKREEDEQKKMSKEKEINLHGLDRATCEFLCEPNSAIANCGTTSENCAHGK